MCSMDIESVGAIQHKYNPSEFPSQQHDSIGWINSSPEVSSDQPEKFPVAKFL